MNKIEKMIKEGTFTESLTNDTEFVKECKEIIKKETGKDISDAELEQLINDIAKQLENPNELKEYDLDEISGGDGIYRNIGKKLVHSVVIGATTAIGASIVGLAGAGTGQVLSNLAFNENDVDQRLRNNLSQPAVITGAGFGGAAGAAVGALIGRAICKRIDKFDKKRK